MILSLKNKISDQEEQIQTLIKKRRDDLEKVKEFERTKIQLDQVCLLNIIESTSIMSFDLNSYNPISVKLKKE